MEKEQNREVLIKQFMKSNPRISVNEFCREYNVTLANPSLIINRISQQ